MRATPLASVSDEPAATDPFPRVTDHWTLTPAIGEPPPSTTLAASGFGRRVPTVPICPSPDAFWMAPGALASTVNFVFDHRPSFLAKTSDFARADPRCQARGGDRSHGRPTDLPGERLVGRRILVGVDDDTGHLYRAAHRDGRVQGSNDDVARLTGLAPCRESLAGDAQDRSAARAGDALGRLGRAPHDRGCGDVIPPPVGRGSIRSPRYRRDR